MAYCLERLEADLVSGLPPKTDELKALTSSELAKLLSELPDVPGRAIWYWLGKSELLDAVKDAGNPTAIRAHLLKAYDAQVSKLEARLAKLDYSDAKYAPTRAKWVAAKDERAIARAKFSGPAELPKKGLTFEGRTLTDPELAALSKDELYLLLSKHPDLPGTGIYAWLSRERLTGAIKLLQETDSPSTKLAVLLDAHKAQVDTLAARYAKAYADDADPVTLAKAENRLERARAKLEEIKRDGLPGAVVESTSTAPKVTAPAPPVPSPKPRAPKAEPKPRAVPSPTEVTPERTPALSRARVDVDPAFGELARAVDGDKPIIRSDFEKAFALVGFPTARSFGSIVYKHAKKLGIRGGVKFRDPAYVEHLHKYARAVATLDVKTLEDLVGYGSEYDGLAAFAIPAKARALAKGATDFPTMLTHRPSGAGSDWEPPFLVPGSQSTLIRGGAHTKETFVDEAGREWMGKPASKGGWAAKAGAPDTSFLAHGEDAAHRVLQDLGISVAPSHLGTFQGRTYHFQKLFTDVKRNGLDGVSPATLTEAQRVQVFEHQVADWLIGNQDSHSGNFLILGDDSIVSIDKGQAMKFLGKDELTLNYEAPGNFGESYYKKFWRSYEAGEFDIDLHAIDGLLDRIDSMSDDAFASYFREYAVGRVRARGLPSSMASYANPEEFLAAAKLRKKELRKNFDRFRTARARAVGREFTPEPKKKRIRAFTPANEDSIRAIRNGGYWDKLHPKAEEEIDALLASGIAERPVKMRVPASVLPKIMEDGRLKSQFETKTSKGSLTPDYRAEVEEKMFGYPRNLDPVQRPVYGYIRDGEFSDFASGYSAHYGDLVLVFKDEVKDRTTVTFGDSLGLGAVPSPVRAPKLHSGSGGMQNRVISQKNSGELRDFDELERSYGWGYTEIQIHGGASLDDVESLVVTYYARGYLADGQPMLRHLRELRARGIKIKLADKEGNLTDWDGKAR